MPEPVSSSSNQNMCVPPDDASGPQTSLEERADELGKTAIKDLIETACKEDLKEFPDSWCELAGDMAQKWVDDAYARSQQPGEPSPPSGPTGGEGGSDNTGGAGGGG
jgi:hypothetical protein